MSHKVETISLLEFCKKLPKVDIHSHLNGSLSQETLKALGVPLNSLKNYQIINNIPGNTQEKLNACFKLFKIAHDATNTVDSVVTATKHVIEEFHKDNVIYLELRTTPRQEQNMTKKEYIEAVVRAIQETKLMKVKLILCINRTDDLKVSEEALELILKMHKAYPDIIKGVDLCGNPNEGVFPEALFAKAREAGLKVTLHCAEVKNDEEVLKMLKFKPDRIGHGTFIHPDYGGSKEAWELYQDLWIPIECCLTSNVICGTTKSYEEHHAQELLKSDLPFCFNTDDKGVFNTCASEEYFRAAEKLNLSKNYLLSVTLCAIEYSFASDEEKKELRKVLYEFEKEKKSYFV